MNSNNSKINNREKRRKFGSHLTSIDIFNRYIFPEIRDKLNQYVWVDFFAGEGNLILPILDHIPLEQREQFFKKNIFLFDVQKEMVQKSIEKAQIYGISRNLAIKNIRLRDNLGRFPLQEYQKTLYHITNPPYLYLGYIRKHKETVQYLKYFEGKNEGYQDLYQIAMINDLRNGLHDLIYIIPTNFLFGASVSNKFRMDFLKYYSIKKLVIFETKMFEFTGTNICIAFFSRKSKPLVEEQSFLGFKIKKNETIKKEYVLKPRFKYRAGSLFDEFLENYKINNPLKVNYYLEKKETIKNAGRYKIKAIDANKYSNNKYPVINLEVNEFLKKKIESNSLYIKTVDTGSYEGRVGLGVIKKDFGVDAIFVSGNTYRTHPIQIFLEPVISIEDQLLLKDYFNYLLEYFRKETDSEFLTTYKYSSADYTRKYLGLTQTRKLIETFPYEKDTVIKTYILNNEVQKLFTFLKSEIKDSRE